MTSMLAQTDPLADLARVNSGPGGAGLSEILLVLGATVGVGLLILVFVYYSKRRSGHGHKIYRSNRPEEGSRRKKKRREGKSRPPTLAETGGLPPLRTDPPPGNPEA